MSSSIDPLIAKDPMQKAHQEHQRFLTFQLQPSSMGTSRIEYLDNTGNKEYNPLII